MNHEPSDPNNSADPQPEQPEIQTPHAADQVGASDVSMSPVEVTMEPARTMSRYVAIAVGVAAIAGAAVLMSSLRSDTAATTASSPTEAVEAMVRVLGAGDLQGVVRAELPFLGNLSDLSEASLEASGLPDGRITGLKLEPEALTYEVEEIGDEIALVSITGGSFRAGVDFNQLPQGLKDQMASGFGGVPTAAIEQSFPVSQIASNLCDGSSNPNCDPAVIKIVTVNDGAGWRASMLHTIIYLMTPAQLEARQVGGAASPEEIPDLISAAIKAQDGNAFLDLLDPREFAWLSDFNFPSDGDGGDTLFDMEATVTDTSSVSARLHIEGFSAVTTPGKNALTDEVKQAAFDGDCFYDDLEESGCLSDLPTMDLGPFEMFQPLLDQIAADGINLGLAQRNSRWYLSIAETFEPYSAILADAFSKLEALGERCQAASQSGDEMPAECEMLSFPGFFGARSYETSSSNTQTLEYQPAY